VDLVERTSRARRGLLIYFVVLVLGSGILEALIARTQKPIGEVPFHVLALMWMPALASLIARLALREGPGDVSFRFTGRHGWRALLIAWSYPVAVGALAYGVGWLTAGTYIHRPFHKLGLEIELPLLAFAIRLGINLLVGTLVGSLFAAGEEIGWRGFMLTRLLDAGVRRPVLLSGLVWGFWHMPLILTGQYAAGPSPVISSMIFLVDIVIAGYIFAYLRLSSGSVWPAIVGHASWNAVIQGVFDAHTENPGIWLGESGLLVTAAEALVLALIWRHAWAVRRTPADPPALMRAASL
jgi:uncharacterized protein